MEFHFVKAEKFNNVLNESYGVDNNTVSKNKPIFPAIDGGGRTKFKWK